MENQRVVGFKASSNTAARARRKQPADVDALGYRAPDAGLDQPFLFAVPDERVAPSVRGGSADDEDDAFWRDALDRIN
ncbi:MAG TPA: hypothetical protein VGU66_01700 [Candidatus Elarobacter sp.]|nr:hypothetical protein [Candidatus Elarobacter sp.]